MKLNFSFLLPPKTKYKDVYDVGKFDLTWKMAVFISIFLTIVVIGYLIFQPHFFGAAVYAWLLSLGFNVALYYVRQYKLIGFLYSLHACIFFGIVLSSLTYVIHALEFFWMIVFT